MKNQIKSVIALVAICAVVAILLALTNALTLPVIEKAEAAAVQEALREVLPTGENFQLVELGDMKLPLTVTEVYREQNGGYAVRLKTSGYSSGMVLLCGIDAEGNVTGAVCLSSSETLGYEKTFGSLFIGKSAESVMDVDTVANATKTTTAYRNAVKDALEAVAILKEVAE